MPVQELEREHFPTTSKIVIKKVIKSSGLTLTGSAAYETVINPDPGGINKPPSALENTIWFAEPSDRNLVPTESQKPEKIRVSSIYFNSSDHADYLNKVATTQEVFDRALGVKNEKRIHSYNPVFDRVNIDMAITPEQKVAAKERMRVDNETNLRERYHAATSVVKYILDENGIAYGENSIESADAIFARGALYRIRQGSPEAERELSTVIGGMKAKRKLADPNTPLHSKMVIISGTGVARGTAYADNFVDIYESDLDQSTGKRIIVMTRFASSLNYDDYKERVIRFNPDYFKRSDDPIDAYLLANPIFVDSSIDSRFSRELFTEEFSYQKEVMKEEDFQEIMKVCLPFILNYIEVVCSETFNSKGVAIAFNAVLNKADLIKRQIVNGGKNILQRAIDFGAKAANTFKSLKEEANWLGRQVVEKVRVGCGLSGGFSVGSVANGIKNLVSGTVSRMSGIFGGEIGKKGRACTACKKVNYCTEECYDCGGKLEAT